VRLVLRKLGIWLGMVDDTRHRDERELRRLADAGVLSETEYRAARERMPGARDHAASV
jgi:hypothetical protein